MYLTTLLDDDPKSRALRAARPVLSPGVALPQGQTIESLFSGAQPQPAMVNDQAPAIGLQPPGALALPRLDPNSRQAPMRDPNALRTQRVVGLGGALLALLSGGKGVGGAVGAGLTQGATQARDEDEAYYQQQEAAYRQWLDSVMRTNAQADQQEAIEGYRRGVDDYEFGRNQQALTARDAREEAQRQAREQSAYLRGQQEDERKGIQEFTRDLEMENLRTENRIKVDRARPRSGGRSSATTRKQPFDYAGAYDPGAQVQQIEQMLRTGYEESERYDPFEETWIKSRRPLTADRREDLNRQYAALRAQMRAGGGNGVPAWAITRGITPDEWGEMTAEERAIIQQQLGVR